MDSARRYFPLAAALLLAIAAFWKLDGANPWWDEGWTLSVARTWAERGPTWDSVFQTVEGGLGYWAGNRFRYGPPKLSMNGTPQCYDYEVGSPGWSFFYDTEALPDDPPSRQFHLVFRAFLALAATTRSPLRSPACSATWRGERRHAGSAGSVRNGVCAAADCSLRRATRRSASACR